MKKPIEPILCGTVELDAFPGELESTETRVWLSRTVRGQVHGALGVSTGDLDIVITEDFFTGRGRWQQVLEVARKMGKYGGAQRVRLCLRRSPEEQARDLRPVVLTLTEGYDTLCVSVRDRYTSQDELYREEFRRWSHIIDDPERCLGILTYHWTSYYLCVPWDDVQGIAVEFREAVMGLTKSAANRLASRMLYDLARKQGWRKLTLREQKRWGLTGQWHRDEECVAARAKLGAPNGVSEATNRAANGGTLEHPPTKWDEVADDWVPR
jgi:hypothetical protein